MRKITKDAANAFRNRKGFRRSNTEVVGNIFYLHGHAIAQRMPMTGKVLFSMCGWPTSTTRERLNGLFDALGLPIRVYQHKGEQYILVRGPLPQHEVNISARSEFYFSKDSSLEVL